MFFTNAVETTALGQDDVDARSRDMHDYEWLDLMNMAITVGRQHAEVLINRGKKLDAVVICRKAGARAMRGGKELVEESGAHLKYARGFMATRFDTYHLCATTSNNLGLLEESHRWIHLAIQMGTDLLGSDDPTVQVR